MKPAAKPADAGARSRLWVWFVVLALLQAAAWTAWLVIASRHQVAEVPLADARTRDAQSEIRH